jgi:hypothetical protein
MEGVWGIVVPFLAYSETNWVLCQNRHAGALTVN